MIRTVLTPRSRADLPRWSPGMAVLGGGTWLFSEPQPDLDTLVDLAALRWDDLVVDGDGLHVAGTCTLAALSRFAAPADWRTAGLIRKCCDALLGSFKVCNVATVGGNLCLALPASPMAALAVALGGVAILWTAEGGDRRLAVVDLVRGDRQTALAPGEILRSLLLPSSALRERFALRRMSLTPLGRSAALVIGTRRDDGAFALTLTAATSRPIRLDFAGLPGRDELAARIEQAVTAPCLWHGDVHGDPAWRRHLGLMFAEEIRIELGTP